MDRKPHRETGKVFPKPSPKPQPKPQPKPVVKPQVVVHQTRPKPATVHVDIWNHPEVRRKPVVKRAPRVVVPVINHRRKTVQLAIGESCYYEGKATVDTNLLFDSSEGYFYVTSQRVIMDAPRNSFNVYINDISKCRKITGGIELTIISRVYRIFTYEASTIKKIIDELMYQYELNDVAEDYALNNSYVSPVQTVTPVQVTTPVQEEVKDPYEELKKLKELLDMGIISLTEFEYKKKQLLGL